MPTQKPLPLMLVSLMLCGLCACASKPDVGAVVKTPVVHLQVPEGLRTLPPEATIDYQARLMQIIENAPAKPTS